MPLKGRSRGVLACENCRRDKRKCDGVRPLCSTCSRRSIHTSCVYEKPGTRKSQALKQIELLERRLAELEGNRQPSYPQAATSHDERLRHQDPVPTPNTRSAYSQPSHFPADVPSDSNERHQLHRFKPFRSSHDESPVGGQLRQPGLQVLSPDVLSDRVDGMGAIAGDITNLTNLDAVEVGYFGKSSTLDFVGHVQRILADSRPRPPVAQAPKDKYQFMQRHAAPLVSEDYIVPPRKEADTLLLRFWKKIHPLYPFLDRAQFERQYNDIWTSSPTDLSISQEVVGLPSYRAQQDEIPASRRFHILLNAIFAVSCSCNTSASGVSQTHRGESFWQRGKALLELDFDIFNRPNLTFVQAMLYVSIYLQSSTELTGACWNLVGVSVRLAQGLGLHNQSSHRSQAAGRRDAVEPDHEVLSCLRCRIWAGCVMMDRTLATTYGRDTMISDTLANQLLLTGGTEPVQSRGEGRESEFVFFFHCLKLEQTLGTITSTLYENSSHDDLRPTGSDLFRAPHLMQKVSEGDYRDLVLCEGELLKWERALPSCVKVPSIADLLALRKPPLFNVQAVTLRARYLYGHILASRPILLHRSRPGPEVRIFSAPSGEDEDIPSVVGRALVTHGVAMCIKIAKELVLLLQWVHQSYPEAVPEPFIIIFYLYTCGMVLLLARHIGGHDTLEYWQTCVATLRIYESTHRTASRCIKLLELSEKSLFPDTRSHTRAQTPVETEDPSSQAPSQRLELCQDSAGNARSSFTANTFLPILDHVYEPGVSGNPQEELPSFWLDDQFDIAWLGTLPFDLNFDETMGELW